MAQGKSKPDDDRVALTQEEIELVVRVLERHRITLPTYLQSMQKEIALIDSILSKLS